MAMFFTEPERIVFESDMDVVAYVSGGMCIPSKKDFEIVMASIRNSHQSTVEAVATGSTKTVIVNGDGIPDPELLERYMREVYKNRRAERMKTVGYVLLTASIALAVGKNIGRRSAFKEVEATDCDRHNFCIGNEVVAGDIPGTY